MGKRRVEKKRDVAELSLLMENLDRFEAPLTHHCETCISVAAACAKGKARGCVDKGEEAHRNSATVLSKCAWRHCHVLAFRNFTFTMLGTLDCGIVSDCDLCWSFPT